MREFLTDGDKVRVRIRFRGRELISLEESAKLLWRSLKEKEDKLKVSLEEMDKTEEKLKELSSILEKNKIELHKRVVGQEDAIRSIARAIRRSRVGLKGKHLSLIHI